MAFQLFQEFQKSRTRFENNWYNIAVQGTSECRVDNQISGGRRVNWMKEQGQLTGQLF